MSRGCWNGDPRATTRFSAQDREPAVIDVKAHVHALMSSAANWHVRAASASPEDRGYDAPILALRALETGLQGLSDSDETVLAARHAYERVVDSTSRLEAETVIARLAVDPSRIADARNLLSSLAVELAAADVKRRRTGFAIVRR